MLPLRRAVVAAAIGCFIAAVALTPSEVRSRLRAAPANAPLAPPAASAPLAIVLPDGDPFAARAGDDDALASHELRPASSFPFAFARVGPLPPNAGAGAFPLAGGTPVVRAIALGANPSALIDDGGSTHLVSAGDRLGMTSVATIDAGGVTLADGRHLALATSGARE
jgi:hypothetical protein